MEVAYRSSFREKTSTRFQNLKNKTVGVSISSASQIFLNALLTEKKLTYLKNLISFQ